MRVIMPIKILTVFLLLTFRPFIELTKAQTDSLYYLDSINVYAPSFIGGNLEGRLLDVYDDSLKMIYTIKEFVIPLKQIEKLEVVTGEESNTWTGAMYGGLIGGAIIGTIAAIDEGNHKEKGFELKLFSPTEAFVTGFFVGGLGGSLLGLIIGSQTVSPTWEEVNLQNLKFSKNPRFPYLLQEEIITEPPPEEIPQPEEQKKIVKTEEEKEFVSKKSSVIKIKKKKQKKKIRHIPQKEVDYNDWHLAVSFGTNYSGPTYNIEKAIRDNGWDDPKPIYGLFHIQGYEERPESNTGFGVIGIPWSLELTYRLSNFFDVGLLTSNNPIGFTKGYRSETKKNLYIEYSSWIFSAFLQFKLTENLHLGLGPVLCSNKIHESVLSNIIKTQLGALFLFRFIYPANTPLFVKFDFQYRLTPTTSFGPINLSGGSEIALQKFDADFSHTFLGLGIGVSF